MPRIFDNLNQDSKLLSALQGHFRPFVTGGLLRGVLQPPRVGRSRLKC